MQSCWPKDPRSPSADFKRTPIIDGKRLIPIQDPRSPTLGVPRTPIVVIKKRDLADSNEQDKKPNYQTPPGKEAWGAAGASQQAAAAGVRPEASLSKPKEHKPIRRRLFTTPDKY